MDFSELIMGYEAHIRLAGFFGIFAAIALWEVLAPRRRLNVSKSRRWVANIGIVVLNTLVVRLLFPAAAVGMASFAQSHGWGLFNYLSVPYWLVVIASVLALDLAIYLQHVMFHAVPTLWRLHRMHHADLDFDLTTGARFHPIEIVLSMLIKFAVIAVLGIPTLAVLVFEVILNVSAMFNHGNVRIPIGVDRLLRAAIVTPDMHRVHHSVEDDETNSNFGFFLSWWDRVLGTYRAQPRAGHEGMTIGIRRFRDVKQCAGLAGMLVLPFKGKVADYAINRRQWNERDEIF